MKAARIALAIVAFASLLAVGRVAAPAHACSCAGIGIPSETFVGQIARRKDNDFVFVDITGQPAETEIRLSISAREAEPIKFDGKCRSSGGCNLDADQPLVGGVYRVTRVAGSNRASSCSPATFELLSMPDAPVSRAEPSRWPWLSLAVLPIAALYAALALRQRRRTSGRAFP